MKDVEATSSLLHDLAVCVRMYSESALNKLTADMATAADDGSATGAAATGATATAASKDKFLNAKPIEVHMQPCSLVRVHLNVPK